MSSTIREMVEDIIKEPVKNKIFIRMDEDPCIILTQNPHKVQILNFNAQHFLFDFFKSSIILSGSYT